MSSFSYSLATSAHPTIRRFRRIRKRVHAVALPMHPLLSRAMLHVFVGIRCVYFFLLRVCVCEPLFKGYCTQYGAGLRTDVYVHWVQGHGQLFIGDHVRVDGKCSFSFAARYHPHPTLSIGDHSTIGHGCSFTVGERIRIGRHCRIAAGAWFFDVSGHASDPETWLAGEPARTSDVRPITVEDNVWIGGRAIIYPGVTIGAGSIVSAGAVVVSNVPPNTIVAGNPARPMAALPGASSRATPAELRQIIECISAIGDIGPVDPDEDFYEAGFTSFRSLPLVLELEERWGVTIPDEPFMTARTARRLHALVASLGVEAVAR